MQWQGVDLGERHEPLLTLKKQTNVQMKVLFHPLSIPLVFPKVIPSYSLTMTYSFRLFQWMFYSSQKPFAPWPYLIKISSLRASHIATKIDTSWNFRSATEDVHTSSSSRWEKPAACGKRCFCTLEVDKVIGTRMWTPPLGPFRITTLGPFTTQIPTTKNARKSKSANLMPTHANPSSHFSKP